MTKQFPDGEGMLLSEYALRHFGGTHKLDTGKPDRSRLDKFLIDTYGSDDLQNHGIMQPLVSLNVFSKGVISDELIGVPLLTLNNYEIKNITSVWIFENINTADRLHYASINTPYIIGGGWINQAVKTLIKRLIDTGVKVYYHGDIDIKGLQIANNVLSEFPEIKTPLMNLSTWESSFQVKELNRIPKEPIRHFRALHDKIAKTKLVVNEEAIPIDALRAAIDAFR